MILPIVMALSATLPESVVRGQPLNNVGVAPDVRIPPSDTADALGFARRYLRDHPRRE